MPEPREQVPVCDICSSYISRLEQLIQEEGISWNTLTQKGIHWLLSSGAQQFLQQIGDINHYLGQVLQIDDQEAIYKDVFTGRTDPSVFNWEMHEILNRVKHQSYKENIENVLKAFCVRNQNIGYCQGLNYVAAWLLMFMDEQSAFGMLSYLIERWLLPDFYVGGKRGNSLNGFYIESTVISALLEFVMPTIKEACLPPNDFCDFFSLQILIQLFINVIDVESTIFLWDNLAAQGSIALIKGVVSLVIISERAIRNKEHPIQILKTLANSRIQAQLRHVFADLEVQVTDTRVERLRGQARDYRAKQWQNAQNVTLMRLQNATHFSKEEIQILQDQFQKLLEEKRQQKPKQRQMSQNIMRRNTVLLPEYMINEIQNIQGEIDIGISKFEFLEYIRNFNPNLEDWGEALFDNFDEDKSGYLDFRELIICISILSKGSLEDKLRVCFEVCDTDKTGGLNINQIQVLINSALKPYYIDLQHNFTIEKKQNIDNIYKKVMSLVNSPHTEVNFDIFRNTVVTDPLVYQCFSEYVGNDTKGEISFNNLLISPRQSHVNRGCTPCTLI